MTVNFAIQIFGLILGFFGGSLLTYAEIKSRKQINKETGTYWDANPFQKKAMEEKSTLAIISTVFITIGFLLQLVGLLGS